MPVAYAVVVVRPIGLGKTSLFWYLKMWTKGFDMIENFTITRIGQIDSPFLFCPTFVRAQHPFPMDIRPELLGLFQLVGRPGRAPGDIAAAVLLASSGVDRGEARLRAWRVSRGGLRFLQCGRHSKCSARRHGNGR